MQTFAVSNTNQRHWLENARKITRFLWKKSVSLMRCDNLDFVLKLWCDAFTNRNLKPINLSAAEIWSKNLEIHDNVLICDWSSPIFVIN